MPDHAAKPHSKPAADHRTGTREDGWTPRRQAEFLSCLAAHGSVTMACEMVDMSTTSAYLLKQSSRGLAFAIGWRAAHLMARETLGDTLLELAIHGTETVIERDEGCSVRRGISPMLSMAMLNRLDRLVAEQNDREIAMSRTIAANWDRFTTLILKGGGEAELRAFFEAGSDPLDRICPEKIFPAKRPNTRQLVEKSAIFAAPAAGPVTPEPCSCPADRKLELAG